MITGVGSGFTITDMVSDAVQLFAPVTVTEYDVVIVGETMIVPVIAALLHAYPRPVPTVSVSLLPIHIWAEVAIISAAGGGLTITDFVTEALQ